MQFLKISYGTITAGISQPSFFIQFFFYYFPAKFFYCWATYDQQYVVSHLFIGELMFHEQGHVMIKRQFAVNDVINLRAQYFSEFG